VHIWESGEQGRLTPADVETLCPDWRERDTYASGPGELLDALSGHWDGHGAGERLHLERFQPVVGGADSGGAGGTIRFPRRQLEAECPPGTPMLVAGEEAGVDMPFGCRMGVCHTCVPKTCGRRATRWCAPASTPPRARSSSTSDPTTPGRPPGPAGRLDRGTKVRPPGDVGKAERDDARRSTERGPSRGTG
jgi:hypothetical protein